MKYKILIFFSILFYSSIFSQISENFESTTGAPNTIGWSTAGSSATTGNFIIGNPNQVNNNGVNTQPENDNTPGSGINAMYTAPNSSPGFDDVDGGVAVVTSPLYSITVQSSLNLFYFHGQRDTNDNPGDDFFVIETSFNNGATYTPLIQIGDVRTQATWRQATLNNIPAGSQLRIRVRVSDGVGAGDLIEGGIDDITITQDIPEISINDVTVNEGDGTATFTVSHTGIDVLGGFSVTYNTSNGSAVSPDDYTGTLTPGTITFSGVSGETQTISIPIINDAPVELDENFFVNLLSTNNPNVSIDDNQGTGTIVDDIPPIIIINGNINICDGFFTDSGGIPNNYSNNENFVFTICPDTAGTSLITDFLEFATEINFDELNIYDGNSTSSPLIGSFDSSNPPGRIRSTDLTGCLTFEFDSDFSVNFSGWLASLECSRASLDVTDLTINENAGTATLTVTLSEDISGGFSVDFITLDGSAFEFSDYTPQSGTLNFVGTAGENFDITVPIVDNNFSEPNEDFSLDFNNYSIPYITSTGGIVTIIDDATDTPIPFNVPLTIFEEFNGYFDYALTGDSFRNDTVNVCSISSTKPPVPLTTPIITGATIEKAFLYWTHSGPSPDNVVTFEGQQVTADIINGASFGVDPYYNMISDVTSIILGIPNPSTNLYDLEDLTIDNGPIYCGGTTVLGGWNLIILYSEPTTLPAVSINIYNGFDGQQNQQTNYNLTGFFAIGSARAKTTILSWEGDVDLNNNEQLSIEVGLTPGRQKLVGDGDNDGITSDNPFNSSLFDNTAGTNVNRPTLGLDFDTYDISPFINTGESSVNVQVNVGQDFVILNGVLIKVPSNLVIGNVFEDINYSGGAGRDKVSTGNIGVFNTTVELYRENPAGSGTFTIEESTTTDNNGQYIFGGMANGNYRIRVVNNTVRSSRVGGAGCMTCIPIQTFKTNFITATDTYVPIINEVGGTNPNGVDSAASVLSGAQSVASIEIDSEGIVGIDFGFNFNTIVNTNSSGQGSIAQFITNSNNLENTTLDIEPNSIFDPALGEDTSIFMIPPTSDALGRTADVNYDNSTGIFDITILDIEDLPIVIGDNTIIDGRTQTAYSTNTNPGVIGAGTNSVGASGTTLPTYSLPEIQVHQNNGDVFRLNSIRTTLRNIAVFSNENAGVSIQGGNVTVANNLIGTNADGNNSGNIANGIEIEGATANSTITSNYIATNSDAGIFINGGASSSIIGNHLNGNGTDTCSDNILIRNNSLNVSINNNLIEGASGYGIDANELTSGNLVLSENTIRESGQNGGGCFGTIENAGVILAGSNSNISNNIINNNNGAGIILTRGNSTGNLISQNSIFANGTATIKTLGIDLNPDPSLVNPAPRISDGITLNETNDLDNGPNELINFPIIETSTLSGNIITVTGWTRPNTKLEFFLSDISLGTSSLGDNQLTGRMTDYGEGQLFIGDVIEGSIDDLDTTTSTYNFDGNTDNTNRFRFKITISNQVPIIRNFITATATNSDNSTSEFSPISELTVASVITNRRITYRVGLTEPDNGITGSLTKNISLLNFQDGNNSSQFNLTFKNNTAAIIADYQILIQKTPYNTIPGLVLGTHTLNTTTNMDGTFNHVFTSTAALNPNETKSITGSAPTPFGIGISCGCITFYQ